MKQVKQFGLHRSGTNYMRLLLGGNFQAEILINKGGWKHGRYQVKEKLGKHVASVVVFKHPLSWLISMWKYEGKPCKFAHYVKRGLMIEHWNAMHRHWLDVKTGRSKMVFVNYEAMLASPEKVVKGVAKDLKLTAKPKAKAHGYVYDHQLSRTGLQTNKPMKAGFYLKKKYMKAYGDGLLEFVKEMIDDSVMKELGLGW